MIDTSRVLYVLPVLGAGQVVHYRKIDDLDFIQRWISYLIAHSRVTPSVSYTRINATAKDPQAAPRLVVVIRDGHCERSEHLRLGRSLILHEGQFIALDTELVRQNFRLLRDPFADHPADHRADDRDGDRVGDRSGPVSSERSLTIAGR